jgi:hypothetical protein
VRAATLQTSPTK